MFKRMGQTARLATEPSIARKGRGEAQGNASGRSRDTPGPAARSTGPAALASLLGARAHCRRTAGVTERTRREPGEGQWVQENDAAGDSRRGPSKSYHVTRQPHAQVQPRRHGTQGPNKNVFANVRNSQQGKGPRRPSTGEWTRGTRHVCGAGAEPDTRHDAAQRSEGASQTGRGLVVPRPGGGGRGATAGGPGRAFEGDGRVSGLDRGACRAELRGRSVPLSRSL